MGAAGARARNVCFAHVPVDPAALETRLPHALSVATREGTGWVSVLGMRTRPLAGPVALPWSFAQVTIRTYVEADGTEAVYFLRVDADTRVAAALSGRLFGVPFQHVDAQVDVQDDEVEVRTHAPRGRPLYVAAFDRSDDAEPPPDGSLDAWLTDRDRFALGNGRTGTVDHDTWRVATVDCHVLRDELLSSEGLPEAAGEPRYRYSPGVDIELTRWPGR